MANNGGIGAKGPSGNAKRAARGATVLKRTVFRLSDEVKSRAYTGKK